MGVSRTQKGRYRATHKRGRKYCCSRVFDRKAHAVEWLETQRLLAARVTPDGSKRVLDDWLQEYWPARRLAVRNTTYLTDVNRLQRLPLRLRRRSVSSISSADIDDFLKAELAAGYAWASVKRLRESLAALFGWLLKQSAIAANPVTGVVLPRRSEPKRQMVPWSAAELPAVIDRWIEEDRELGHVAALLATSGLRWSEARALVASDLDSAGTFLSVTKAQPESESKPKATKSTLSRRVPVSELVRPYLLARKAALNPNERLLPPLWRSGFIRRLNWAETAPNRTIHDLRHTAICLWLQSGIDPLTVKNWAGHADFRTLAIYTHLLGDEVSIRALEKLDNNLRGTPGAQDGKENTVT